MSGAAARETMDATYDVARIREDFPILADKMHGQDLVFLDNGASAQKPRQVLDAMRHLYEHEYANVHRGAYWLSERATARYEGARDTVQRFLNAKHRHEIVFTRNATESINLVAHAYGQNFLKPGDEVVISEMEHHSNIVPWYMLKQAMGVELKIAPVADDGSFRLDAFRALLSERTKLVAITHVSNVLGTVVPLREVIDASHAAGAVVLVDGSQAVMHRPVDVQALGCDFYVFTGHKLYGPSGIGVLYGREALLDAMPPFLGGGDMIRSVSFTECSWAPLPAKFEAGTPAIAQAAGLAAAIDYVTGIGLDRIGAHEHDLLTYATQKLAAVEGLRIVGTAPGKSSIISFTMDCAHPHDISTIVDRAGVALRAGHHCAQPLMERMGVPATVRASFGLYNMRAEADKLAAALHQVQEIFG